MSDEQLFGHVLLIEDDPSHALLVKRALKPFVADVAHVEQFSECWGKIKAVTPELIITDLNLPDVSSLSHVRALSDKFPDIPLIVLTSSNSLRDAVEAMKFGAQDYLVKNFDENFSEALGFALSRVHSLMLLSAERLKLQREMRTLQVAIENSNDGLAVVGPAGQILYANESFQEFVRVCDGCARSLSEIFGSKVVKSKLLQENVLRNIRELPPGSVWNTDVLFVENKQAAFNLSLSIVAGGDKANLTERNAVLWLRDISEQKRREKFQREILSTTTHDLKGPLGAIILSSEMLQEMLKGQNRAYELALRVGSSAQSAVNLIDEFLSARRIQEGNFILKPSLQDLGALVENVLSDYRTIAASRSISLDLKRESPKLEAHVDKLGFCRVVGNLLTNAVKFTPKGGKIGVELSAGPDEVRLIVRDTGCGMEPAEVRKVFERFSRLEKHSETPGTGLGLFVVKCVVAAHGGKIDVTSQVGHGTSFDVSWPIHPPVNERGELISLDFA